MYVLFDLEWVTAEDGTPTMTQLAALRTDGAWQSQETTLSAKPALSVREQNARWVQASPYNYIYLKNSPVFHRRECRLVLNSKELLGSVHYRTAAKGRRPCKMCRPLPLSTQEALDRAVSHDPQQIALKQAACRRISCAASTSSSRRANRCA